MSTGVLNEVRIIDRWTLKHWQRVGRKKLFHLLEVRVRQALFLFVDGYRCFLLEKPWAVPLLNRILD